ncbi:MAG: aldehyde dehydrogenase family protein [Candidatus Heimdallarchaeaceae archaeon]
MTTSIIENLPLLRNGEEYLSSTRVQLQAINGEKLADISFSPELHIQMAIPINKGIGFRKLSKLKIDELIDIYVEAGKIFAKDMNIKGQDTSLEDWAKLVTLSTGMPITYVRNALNMIPAFFQRPKLERLLKTCSPTGELDIFDDLVGTRGTTRFAFTPKGRNVGVALPGNHPGVSLFGCLIPLFKLPAIIRSSSSEPFTSFRICKALWEAGIPYEALFHFVTGHAEVDTLITKSDLGIIFGSDWTIKTYGNRDTIKAYGPGRSKVLVDIENMNSYRMRQALDISYHSIMFDGGRGCINASGIIYNSKEGYEEFKRKLAKRLARIEPYHPLDDEAQLPAMSKEAAITLSNFIKSRMEGKVKDITSDYRGHEDFLYINDEFAYLLPVLLELDENHIMRTDEYPFPFGTITKPEDNFAHELVRNTLSISLVTDKKEKAIGYLRDPSIHKVFVNDSSFTMDLAAPHEGLLTDSLYQKKATNLKI